MADKPRAHLPGTVCTEKFSPKAPVRPKLTRIAPQESGGGCVPISALPSPQDLKALLTALERLSGNLGGLPGSCSPGRDPLALLASHSLPLGCRVAPEAGVEQKGGNRE